MALWPDLTPAERGEVLERWRGSVARDAPAADREMRPATVNAGLALSAAEECERLRAQLAETPSGPSDEIRARLELDGTYPERLVVRHTTEPAATAWCVVVAEYGWAERILCAQSYPPIADALALALGEALEIPVELANVTV